MAFVENDNKNRKKKKPTHYFPNIFDGQFLVSFGKSSVQNCLLSPEVITSFSWVEININTNSNVLSIFSKLARNNIYFV